MVEDCIGMSWGGLADALGMAEVTMSDPKFLANFRSNCIAAARKMRPELIDHWVRRSAAYTRAYEEAKEIERLDEEWHHQT